MGKVVCILLLLPLACYCKKTRKNALPYEAVTRDPCHQYSFLSPINTRSPTYRTNPASHDDHNLAPGWYAAPTRWELLDRDPGQWKTCGTQNPIYRTDKRGQSSTMCIRDRNNACAQTFNISTRMCGPKEIYQLSTPLANSGFCFHCIDRKLDILIITDVSRSISTSLFGKIKNFQRSLVSSIDISQTTNAVALMEFSQSPRVLLSLDSPSSRLKGDVRSTISQQQYENGPSTELADALDMAVTEVFTATNGDRADADNIVVLFTDGWLDKSEEEDVAASIGPLSAKAEVFVVYSKELNSVIRTIASEPLTGHMFPLSPASQSVFSISNAMPCPQA